MKECPSGAHLVLEGRATEGVDLIAIGCKHNSRKVISFICHRNAGSTKCTGFYEAKWKDENNNTQTRRVPRPDIIDRCFRKSNLVDLHNQARQSDLRLEKHWVTQTGCFRLVTALFGMVATDCWKACRHHLPSRHPHKQIEILGFANKLAKDMLENGFSKQAGGDQVLFIPARAGLPPDNQSAVSSLGDLSSPTGGSSRRGATSFSETALSEVAKLRQIEAALDRHKHLLDNGRREVSGGAQRTARSRCKICKAKTKWQCAECQVHLCARKLNNGKESACVVEHLEHVRSEFESDPSP
jgi:hypothetical protein